MDHNNQSITSALRGEILAGSARMAIVDETAVLLPHEIINAVAVDVIASLRGRGHPRDDHSEQPVGEHANHPHLFTSSRREAR
jgi:hypothetical protein